MTLFYINCIFDKWGTSWSTLVKLRIVPYLSCTQTQTFTIFAVITSFKVYLQTINWFANKSIYYKKRKQEKKAFYFMEDHSEILFLVFFYFYHHVQCATFFMATLCYPDSADLWFSDPTWHWSWIKIRKYTATLKQFLNQIFFFSIFMHFYTSFYVYFKFYACQPSRMGLGKISETTNQLGLDSIGPWSFGSHY